MGCSAVAPVKLYLTWAIRCCETVLALPITREAQVQMPFSRNALKTRCALNNARYELRYLINVGECSSEADLLHLTLERSAETTLFYPKDRAVVEDGQAALLGSCASAKRRLTILRLTHGGRYLWGKLALSSDINQCSSCKRVWRSTWSSSSEAEGGMPIAFSYPKITIQNVLQRI